MSFQINCIARTTGFVGELETKTAKDKKEHKSIIFKVVSNREYKSTFEGKDGKTVTEAKPDYMLCRANDFVAQFINDYAKEVKEVKKVNGVDRTTYKSRHLSLRGHLETYLKEKEVKLEKEIEVEGETYKVELKKGFEVVETIFVVDHVEFLDPSNGAKAPAKASKISGDVTITKMPHGKVDGEISEKTMEELSVNTESDSEGAVPDDSNPPF